MHIAPHLYIRDGVLLVFGEMLQKLSLYILIVFMLSFTFALACLMRYMVQHTLEPQSVIRP